MSVKPNYVIRGGQVIDPYNQVDNVLADVSIHNGKVFNIGQGLIQGENEVGYHTGWNLSLIKLVCCYYGK